MDDLIREAEYFVNDYYNHDEIDPDQAIKLIQRLVGELRGKRSDSCARINQQATNFAKNNG